MLILQVGWLMEMEFLVQVQIMEILLSLKKQMEMLPMNIIQQVMTNLL